LRAARIFGGRLRRRVRLLRVKLRRREQKDEAKDDEKFQGLLL
jgi:hypothetical protein